MPLFPLDPKPKSSILYVEEMHDLIEEKKNRRWDLNIFILSSDGYHEEKYKYNSELDIFFNLLSKNMNTSQIPSRFQLAIENQNHWFSVDAYIKNKQVYLLVIDAAGLHRSTELIKKASVNLKPIIFSYSGTQIQCDFEHCSFFTLDHLFRLSNRHQHWNDLIGFSAFAPNTVIYFDHEACPKSLAFIFKNIQSFKGFNKLPNSLKMAVINKKNQTLEHVIKKNSYMENISSAEIKVINIGILLKEKKYKQRATHFFKRNYNEVSNRQGFDIIGGRLGKLITKVIQHKGNNFFDFFTEKDKSLIKTNPREMLDIIIYYELKSFLIFLIETKLLYKEYISISDICSFINKDLNLFKVILAYVKNSLTYADRSEINDQINLYGNTQFKDYFSLRFFEEFHLPSYNSTAQTRTFNVVI